jgi:hypothetical protein
MIGRMPLDDGSAEKPGDRPLTGGLNKEKAGAGRN